LELDPRPLVVRRGREPTPPLLLQMMRGFLWVTALASLAGSLLMAVVFLLGQAGLAAPPRPLGWVFVGVFLVLAIVAAAATRVRDTWLPPALTGLLSVLVLGGVAASVLLGRAVVAPGMPFSALLVCVLCVVAGWRAGAVLAAVAAAAALGLAFLSQPAPGLGLQLGLHLIAIGAGVACGVLVSRVLWRFMRNAQEREERFTRLLGLAADAYWDIDHQYRLQAAGSQSNRDRALTPERGLGRVPWDLPHFSCDPEMLDALIADLDTRVPFRDLPVRWTGNDGKVRSLLLSGEPRFDDRGVFTGYWGVARDETVVHRVHAALAATETRYQELFSHIPTPLVLHRGGRVLDANPAALRLFGHTELKSMIGSDMLAAFESGDSRERARRRMETLHGQPSGTALPVGDFRLAVGGRQVSVRGTAVNVDADGGPAMLAIFVDDTERLMAEESVRRSEALLSHLFATSPDLITLTEMSSGRYAMVNRSFEQLTGYSAAETVGRTAQELGIWGDDSQARDRFLSQVQDRGEADDLPVTFTGKGGKPVRLLLSAARFVMDRREYMVINARDISERERQRLEREAILDNASIGIAVARRRELVLTNRHFEHIYGWAPGELLGQRSAVLWVDADDDETLDAQSHQVPASGETVQPFELERLARRKDGSSFTARIRTRAIDPTRPDEGTIWIVEDVTERRQFEQALARARDDAEAASRAKSAFLANTSHELRTPLNGMIGLARLAQDEHVVPERRREYLDQIATSAQSLAAIISDILDLSKIESGKLQVEKTHFDLGAELHA
ncbi:MAG TPA: PAS domain S-box protein, partial [Rubrivivax sp.]|nr:PAS domain S-box protein [Rubrivivax sp.]